MTEAELIQSTLDVLAPALPNGARMIVFGSRARGDARHDSDIDVLVIENEVVDRSAEVVRLSTLLGSRLIPADVVVMAAEQFENQCQVPNTLAWRALREGHEYELAH